jgi:hypothetical protein
MVTADRRRDGCRARTIEKWGIDPEADRAAVKALLPNTIKTIAMETGISTKRVRHILRAIGAQSRGRSRGWAEVMPPPG